MLKNFDDLKKTTSGSAVASNERNDCFVKAASAAFDIPYDQAHKWVKDNFDRKDKQGTQSIPTVIGAYSKFKFEQFGQLSLFGNTSKTFYIKRLGVEPKQGGNLINPSYTHKKVAFTVKTFAQHYPKGVYILLVYGHALTIKDGIIIDNAEFQADGYRRVVEVAYKVTIKY